jgi:hypothetical protein
MKFKFILLALVILSATAFSQSKNNFSVVYGVSNADVDIHNAVGDYGYDSRAGMLYGLTYTRTLNNKFSIETGLIFSNDKIRSESILPGFGNRIVDGTVKSFSVPVYFKFAFFKYLYADMGMLIDKQTDYSDNSVVNDQSGLGFEVGIGGKYNIGRVSVFVNPYYRLYGASSSSNNNLDEAGLKFGVGYNF